MAPANRQATGKAGNTNDFQHKLSSQLLIGPNIIKPPLCRVPKTANDCIKNEHFRYILPLQSTDNQTFSYWPIFECKIIGIMTQLLRY